MSTTNTIQKPSIETLLAVWQEDYEGDDITIVEDKVVGPADYGHRSCAVFRRTTDDTFWAVTYRYEHDGDYCDFRDGDLDDDDVRRVYPVDRVVRDWSFA